MDSPFHMKHVDVVKREKIPQFFSHLLPPFTPFPIITPACEGEQRGGDINDNVKSQNKYHCIINTMFCYTTCARDYLIMR